MANWLAQRTSFDGKELLGEVTVEAENMMEAKAAATRVFDRRDIRSGLLLVEALKPGVNDQPGYIIDATSTIKRHEWLESLG